MTLRGRPGPKYDVRPSAGECEPHKRINQKEDPSDFEHKQDPNHHSGHYTPEAFRHDTAHDVVSYLRDRRQIVVLFYEMFTAALPKARRKQHHQSVGGRNYRHAALWNSAADYLTTTKQGIASDISLTLTATIFHTGDGGRL